MTAYTEYPDHWPPDAVTAVDLATERAEDAEALVETLKRERDNALAKAAAYERDWYAAKTEFGDARSKLQARIRELEWGGKRVDYPRSVVVGVTVRERLSGVVTEIYKPGSHLEGYAKVEWDDGRYWNNRPVECLVAIDAPCPSPAKDDI